MNHNEVPKQLVIPGMVRGDHDLLCPACKARLQVQISGQESGETAIAQRPPDICVYASLGLMAEVGSEHYQQLQALKHSYSKVMIWSVIFGQNIRAVRIYELQMTLKQAGKKIGVSPSTLRSYELAEWGRIRVSYGRIISCICRGYSYSHDHLSHQDFLVRVSDGYWRGMSDEPPWFNREYRTGASKYRHPLLVSIPDTIRAVAEHQALSQEEIIQLFSRPVVDPSDFMEARKPLPPQT